MGQIYARHLVAMSSVELVGLSDVNEKPLHALADELNIEQRFTDYRDLLNLSNLEAVFVVSPTSYHAEMSMAAAEMGKAVFCEKPISLTLEQTDAVITTLDKTKTMLQVGFMRRYDSGYVAAKTKIEAGVIGKPTTFKSIGRDPFCPPLAYARPETSGGLILDMGIHDFDLARWLMDAEVSRVYSEGGVLAFPELATVGDIDNAVINLKYENGCIGNVEVSRNALYGYDIRTEILGTEGGLNIGYYRETPLTVMQRGGVISHDMVPYMMERFGEAYRRQAMDFVERVSHDKPAAIEAHDARATLIIGLAATKSFHEGRPVEIGEY